MRKSDIYEIAIKILGLYLIVIVIGQLREVIIYATILIQTKNHPDAFESFNQTPIFMVTVFSFLILAAFSGLLILRTKKLTKLICKEEDFEETIKFFTDKKTIYEISLTLVGLLTIILTLPDLVYNLKNHIQLVQNDFSTKNDETSFLIVSGIKFIVGLLAIIFSKAISNFLTGDNNKTNKTNETT